LRQKIPLEAQLFAGYYYSYVQAGGVPVL